MGTYPLFVKTPTVLDAKVPPVIFQSFKSLCVLFTGLVLVVARFMRSAEPPFEFSPWGVASAAAWIPAGLCVIAAVPRVGMGTTVLLFDASTTLHSLSLIHI